MRKLLSITKRKLLSIIMLMMLTLNVSAGSFDALWKEYEKAEQADQPKSAIAALQKIQKTAEKKHSYGDLLKALILEQNQWREISDDSVKTYKSRLLAWQKKQTGVPYTLLQTVLYMEQGAPKVDSLLNSPDASSYTKVNSGITYKPFIEQGIDSKYFNNDLLSIIAMHTRQYKALQHYYSSPEFGQEGSNNRTAACIAAALCIENGGWGGSRMQECDSLISIYGDLPECGAIAVRKAKQFKKDSIGSQIAWIDEALQRWPSWKEMNLLRNMRAEYTQPTCSVSLPSSVMNTDTEVKICVSNARNIKSLKVSLQHIDANGKEDLQRTMDHALPWTDEYSKMTDTISLGRLSLGQWKIKVTNAEGATYKDDIDLYITDLKVIAIGLPQKQIRYVVVNAITGQPVPDATLQLYENTSRGKTDKTFKMFRVNDKGEYIYTYKKNWSNSVKATTSQDYAMPEQLIYNNYYDASKPDSLKKMTKIFTDRAIYRPGQTMHIAVIGYTVEKGKETTALKNEKYTIEISDASYQKKTETVVVTDDFGTAVTDYTIPEDCRTGSWHVSTDRASIWIKVEEYKRPKFIVTIAKPTISYKDGDTITVKGTAKSYSGMPVANAKVVYNVFRNKAWWWRSTNWGSGKLLSDTIFTDADGTFSMRVPMLMPKDGDNRMPMFYSIKTSATVTDNNGESHTEEMSLPLSNRETCLTLDMQSTVLADSAINITFKRLNAAGNEIDGIIKVSIDGKPQADAKANKKYTVAKSIASGKHTIIGICEGDTIKNDFVAFRKSDTTPMTYTHRWGYSSAKEWKDDKDKVWMQIGSSDKNVHVVYDILSNNSVIEQGDTVLNCSNITRTFTYKPEYGDGIKVLYAWVKEGQMYQVAEKFLRALPDKKLNMEWSTFRNKLVPGQKEQWSVRIKNPDGTPAKAQMMAVLYDKSLDQLAKLSWNFNDSRSINLCNTSWSTVYPGSLSRWMSKKLKMLNETGMDFSHIAVSPYPWGGGRYHNSLGSVMMRTKSSSLRGSSGKLYAAAPTMLTSAAADSHSTLREVAVEAKQNVMDTSTEENLLVGSIGGLSVSEDEEGDATSVRSDFSETAFWLPEVIADSKGIATLRFTMPESVTSWKFKAFAHDKDMRYGFLEDEAITQKQLMIEPNMPRFLRINDKATISANVGNLSDKPQNIKVTMAVLDPSTEKTLYNIYNNVRVEAGKSTSVTFPITPTAILGSSETVLTDTSFIVRFTAKGTNFSDGEQHLLPILTDKEEVVDTTSFVVDPKKMIAEALPKLAVPTSNNAITLSNAYYANVMTAHLTSPTPYQGGEQKVSPANDNVLAQLINLQNGDGGFSWYSGMESSKYMTVAVLKTLARVNAICGTQNNTQFLMSKAFTYVQQEMEKEMKYQKEHKYSYLSGTTLDWLYALTLTGKDGGSAETYFRKMLYDETRKDDMQSKAVAGIVMFNNHQKDKAREFAEAIKQHTVYRSDMGRYFDSYRAEYSWCDYKIPTHSMCIEALNDITPLDTTTITEMQKWLVQSKRTQRWDNAINAVNAIYALSLSSAQKPFMAKYTVHPEDLKGAITVTREIIDSRNTSNSSLSSKSRESNPKVGDKVTVRLTIVADRDYDFVTVTDNRAACLEPVNQTSGYHWGGYRLAYTIPGFINSGYYQEMKDQKAIYHFYQFAKGTHVIETEYYIDRKGNYTSGKATAVCEYAPEFRGSTDPYNMEIK